MVWEKLDTHPQKSGLTSTAPTPNKNQLKCIKDLNLKPARLKLLEKNIRNALEVIGTGKSLLTGLSMAQETVQRTNQRD